MNKRISAAVVAILLAVAWTWSQPRRGGQGPGGRPGGGGAGVAAGTNQAQPPSGTRNVQVAPGWGRAPNPGYGNINHPGSFTFPTGPSHIQPLGMRIQPLVSDPFPYNPGGNYHYNDRLLHRYPRIGYPNTVVIGVPVYVPQPVYVETPTGYASYSGAYDNTYPPVQMQTVPPGSGLSVWGGTEPGKITVYRPSQPATPEPASLTLLVFKDHSIYAVSQYWKEGDRIHYVTSYGAASSMPVDQLDLEFTRKLNEERNVKFELKDKTP
jgi:hypothetical protein